MNLNKLSIKDIVNILKNTDAFAGFPHQKITDLVNHSKLISLKEKQYLYRKGTSSDTVHILLEGKLNIYHEEIDNNMHYIGDVYPVCLLGEIGVLTGHKRSVSLIAEHECLLLETADDKFMSLVSQSSDFLIALMRRSSLHYEENMNAISCNEIIKLTTILSASPNVNMSSLKESLENSTCDDNIFFYSPDPEIINDRERLAVVCENHRKGLKHIIYFVENNDLVWRDYCLTKCKNIFLVVDTELNNQFTNFSEGALNTLRQRKLNLILLHHRHLNRPINSNKWIMHFDFHQWVHVKKYNTDDVSRLGRIILDNPNCLVLSGGGVGGWGHVGVLRALSDLNIPIDIIGGCSVGGIVSMLYSRNQNLDTLEEVMRENSDFLRRSLSWSQLTLPIASLFSGNITTKVFNKLFADQLLEDNWLYNYALSFNLSHNDQCIHKTGLSWQASRATTSLPGLYPPLSINGNLHVDGGVRNYLPVDVMINIASSTAKIISVNVSASVLDDNYYAFQPSLSIGKAFLLLFSDKKVPDLTSTLTKSLSASSSYLVEKHKTLSDYNIDLDLSDLGLAKKLSYSQINSMIDKGYQATMKKLGGSDQK